MKIELKKVVIYAGLSEETTAFKAEIWVDGKKSGDVRNSGTGGAHVVDPFQLADEIDAWAKTLPPVDLGYGMAPVPSNHEFVISDLLDAHVAGKTLARSMKKKTVFVRGGKVFETVGRTLIVPGDVVLNDMPLEEAVAMMLRLANDERAGR